SGLRRNVWRKLHRVRLWLSQRLCCRNRYRLALQLDRWTARTLRMSTNTSVLISILIPVRDDNENLRACLRSLSEQDLAGCEILVCDDGSRLPVDAADVAPNGLPVRIFRQVGRGPSVARNFLATKAAGKYLFFMDADTVPCHNTVACARTIIVDNPGIEAFF